MEQKSKYDIEIENFRHNFSGIKNKRIAIYGMGRRSATLLPGITDFNIAGILDRDESNVGKELCGIKVISIKNVEAAVDVIIINSDPSNYEIIYKRIAKNITVPVYYADGRLACLSDEDTSYERNGYWKSSYKELKDKIDRADAVSFDIFDTLIMRKIFSPEDVFRLLGEKVRAELKLDCEIAGIRAQAAAKCGSNATINEIYKQIKKTNLTDTNIADIMQLEKDIDIDLCIARRDIADLYEYCLACGKKVYLISDMYYNSRKDGIDKLLFFARDGYFLEKDYKIVSQLLDDGYKQDWCYLPISRRLIYMATMKSEDDLKRVVAFPYVGTFADYMKSRFEITVTDATSEYNDRQINAVGDSQNILKWIQPYKDKIMEQAKRERENYLDYLKSDGDMQAEVSYGTVDLGYYGTNQYYLQRLTGIKTKGYCFYACLAKDNVYTNDISMYACFQYGDDYTAEKSFARKKNMYIETFITAPHGMIRYIDNQGKMICKPDGKSQEYFDIKEKVNCGAVDFIVDYMNIYKTVLTVNSMEYIKLMQDRRESFEDNLFYNMLNGMCNVSNNILEGFYFDNDFVGGKEIKLEI